MSLMVDRCSCTGFIGSSKPQNQCARGRAIRWEAGVGRRWFQSRVVGAAAERRWRRLVGHIKPSAPLQWIRCLGRKEHVCDRESADCPPFPFRSVWALPDFGLATDLLAGVDMTKCTSISIHHYVSINEKLSLTTGPCLNLKTIHDIVAPLELYSI